MELASIVGLISVLIVIVLETRIQVTILKSKIDVIMRMVSNLLNSMGRDDNACIER